VQVIVLSLLSSYFAGFSSFYPLKFFAKYKTNKAHDKVKNDFKAGLEFERQKLYSEAQASYSACFNRTLIDETSAIAELQKLALCRFLICQSKAGITPDREKLDEIIYLAQNTSGLIRNYFHDLMFRYAIFLMNSDRYNEAADVIYKYLDSSSDHVKDLLRYFSFFKNERIFQIVNLVNEYILANYEISSESLSNLYNEVTSNEEILQEYEPLSARIHDIKQHIANRLVVKYIQDEKFEECLELIISLEDFSDDPILLKNAAICCCRLAMDNKINVNNYKTIIPIWLTAIHSDNVILKSLELSSWDDEYTFTLLESIGSNYKFEQELQNINYDEPGEHNISIGKAQKQLMQLFEVAVERTSKKIRDFYYSEKKVIAQLVMVIPYNTLLPTPAFSKRFKLSNKILEYIDKLHDQSQDENLLKTGAKYVDIQIENKNGNPYVKLTSNYKSELYASSLWYKNQALVAIFSKNVERLAALAFKEPINRYESVMKDFEEAAINELNSQLKQNDERNRVFDIMDKVLEIVPKSENIRYLYASNLNNYCIEMVNNNKLSELNALIRLYKAICVYPDFEMSSKNFCALIRNNLARPEFHSVISSLCFEFSKIGNVKIYNVFKRELIPYRQQLEYLFSQTNIDVAKLRNAISLIDRLIESPVPSYSTAPGPAELDEHF